MAAEQVEAGHFVAVGQIAFANDSHHYEHLFRIIEEFSAGIGEDEAKLQGKLFPAYVNSAERFGKLQVAILSIFQMCQEPDPPIRARS
jgi:hypothetical protein